MSSGEKQQLECGVLASYYAAMNAHDMDKVVPFLADDIEVTFPESERNWAGVANAVTKFGGMFERMPTFRGSCEIEEMTSPDSEGAYSVVIMGRFQCEATGADSSRRMRYRINAAGKITRIDHL